MRLFVSLPVPPVPRSHLAAALAGLRTTDIGQWHLTLAFLGEVDGPDPLLPGLTAAAAASPPLRLRLEGGGRFPGAAWAGVTGDVRGLHDLAGQVRAACSAAGVRPDGRRFRPHVTVARGAAGAAAAGRLRGYSGPEWRAGEVELVRSVLGATARHTAVAAFPLSG